MSFLVLKKNPCVDRHSTTLNLSHQLQNPEQKVNFQQINQHTFANKNYAQKFKIRVFIQANKSRFIVSAKLIDTCPTMIRRLNQSLAKGILLNFVNKSSVFGY